MGLAFWWLPATIARFEHSSVLWAIPFFALFVAYYGLQLALFALGIAWLGMADCRPRDAGRREEEPEAHRNLRGRGLGACLFIASWWVLVERGFPKIVPWSLGDALAAAPPLRQAADLGGVYGLSFLIAFVSAAIASAIVPRAGRWSVRLRPVVVAVAVLALWNVYGVVRTRQFADARTLHGEAGAAPYGSLRVAVVQGALNSGRPDLVAANKQAWVTYAALTEQAVAPAGTRHPPVPMTVTHVGASTEPDNDLIVWPETVLRVYLRQNKLYRQRLLDLTQRLQTPLLLGALDLPTTGRGELNTAYLFVPQAPGGVRTSAAAVATEIYHKHVLLPFGEYVPGATWLPILRRWRTTGRFVQGAVAGPFNLAPAGRDLAKVPIAASICVEAAWPGAFNSMVRRGAEFVTNLTEDGWFGDTSGPYQHLRATELRAVETRRWLVRASNSGVSAFVDPTGRVVSWLPLRAEGVLAHRVDLLRTETLYVRGGNWLLAVSFLCVVVIGARRRFFRPLVETMTVNEAA